MTKKNNTFPKVLTTAVIAGALATCAVPTTNTKTVETTLASDPDQIAVTTPVENKPTEQSNPVQEGGTNQVQHAGGYQNTLGGTDNVLPNLPEDFGQMPIATVNDSQGGTHEVRQAVSTKQEIAEDKKDEKVIGDEEKVSDKEETPKIDPIKPSKDNGKTIEQEDPTPNKDKEEGKTDDKVVVDDGKTEENDLIIPDKPTEPENPEINPDGPTIDPEEPAVEEDPHTKLLEDALARIGTAQQGLIDAKQRVADCENALRLAGATLASKVANVTTGRQQLEQYKADLEARRIDLENAKADLEEAKVAYDEVVKNATDSPEFKEAYATVQKSIDELAVAVNDKKDADKALTEAKASLDEAIKDKEVKDAILEQKSAEKAKADRELADAKKAQKEAMIALQTAKTNDSKAKEDLANAKADLAMAKNHQSNAQRELEDARQEASNADGNISAAEAKLAQAEQAVKEAESVIALGSYGFFQEHEENNVAETIIDMVLEYQDSKDTDLTQTMRTNLGAEGDATSLENMKLVFDYIRKGNDLRANDDTPKYSNPLNHAELLVNDALMAVAQVNANASDGYHGHWGYIRTNYYNTGENAAWGAIQAGYDPYLDWYEREKAVYEYQKDHPNATKKEIAEALGLPGTEWVQTGHYINLMQRYTTTGFAINSDSDSWHSTYIQEFNTGTNKPGEKTFTVDQYEADFLAYYNRVMTALSDAEKARDDAQAELDALQTNGGMTPEQTKMIADAEAKLEKANQEVADAQSKVNTASDIAQKANVDLQTAEDNLDKADGAVDEKTENVEDAKLAVTDAEANVEDAIIEVNEKAEEVQIAEEVVKDAEAVVVEKEDAKAEAESKLAEVEENASEEVKEAKANVEAKEEVVETAEADVTDAEQTVTNQEAVVEQAETELAEAEENVVVAEENLEVANEEVVVAEENLETANTEYEAIVEEHENECLNPVVEEPTPEPTPEPIIEDVPVETPAIIENVEIVDVQVEEIEIPIEDEEQGEIEVVDTSIDPEQLQQETTPEVEG